MAHRCDYTWIFRCTTKKSGSICDQLVANFEPWTLVGYSNHWATTNFRNLVMSRSFAGWHKDRISQSHYIKLTQINSVSFLNLLVLLEVEELVIYSWLLSGSHPQVLWCTNPKNVKTKELSIKNCRQTKEKIKIGQAIT